MLLVISPAKSLDFDNPVPRTDHTQPRFLDDAEALVQTLRTYSPDELASLMRVSDKLGELNVERFFNWHRPFNSSNARQAIYAFTGDVYTGLQARELSDNDMQWAQEHLRILSGLYGVLRPLDLMQPYRLEMGTRLSHDKTASLYEFWDTRVTELLNKDLKKINSTVLLNLASNEYFKAVRKNVLHAGIISPVFKDYKNGQYKIISFYAKKARGLMAAWVIQNRIVDPAQLHKFDVAGYRYDAATSTADVPVFIRKQV